MNNFIYFVGSEKINIPEHPVIKKWLDEREKSGMSEDDLLGIVFPDTAETRAAVAYETSLRKIDKCHTLVAVPKDDGSFGESTTWEIAYALHTDKSVYIGKPTGEVIHVYDVSQFVTVKSEGGNDGK